MKANNTANTTQLICFQYTMSHKAIGHDAWMARLRQYAETGIWQSGIRRPSETRPGTKQYYEKFKQVSTACILCLNGWSSHREVITFSEEK